MIVELLIKEVEDCVGLLDHIQEVQVGIFGIRRRDCCVRQYCHSKPFLVKQILLDTFFIMLKLVADVWYFKIRTA